MAGAAGLEADAVLDLRGNHDAFDALRAGAGDPFMKHSATAEALGPAGAAARARATELPPRLLLRRGGGDGGGGGQADAACPAAVLVGVDATPDVRMHAYT
jgi:hypothetical protein